MFDVVLLMLSTASQVQSLVSIPLLAPKYSERTLMTQNSQKLPYKVSITLLEAYQDNTLPPGVPQSYPLGHAVVRLRVENQTDSHVNFDVKKIEVYQAPNNGALASQGNRRIPQPKLLMGKTLQLWSLNGLQIVEQGFHLTNRQGFTGSKRVKAIVTYQFNNKLYTSESAAIDVIVNP